MGSHGVAPVSRVGLVTNGLSAVAMAALLSAIPGAYAIMPTRRRDLEANFDMNRMIDLGEKDRKRELRKAHLKAAGSRAFQGQS